MATTPFTKCKAARITTPQESAAVFRLTKKIPDIPEVVFAGDYSLDTTNFNHADLMMWVRTGSTTRELVTTILNSDYSTGDVINLNEFFLLPVISSISGTERTIFFTEVALPTGGAYELPQQNTANVVTGSATEETWYDIPAYEGLDGWYDPYFDDVQVIVITNYLTTELVFGCTSGE